MTPQYANFSCNVPITQRNHLLNNNWKNSNFWHTEVQNFMIRRIARSKSLKNWWQNTFDQFYSKQCDLKRQYNDLAYELWKFSHSKRIMCKIYFKATQIDQPISSIHLYNFSCFFLSNLFQNKNVSWFIL